MREGRPSSWFGDRGLCVLSLGNYRTPLLLKLYDESDEVLATLTEEHGACIDQGYVDFFEGPNCRPARYRHHLVEKLPDGTSNILHDNPEALVKNPSEWRSFLGEWVAKHEGSKPSHKQSPRP
ncbi:hypothetical protein [Ferrovum sp.]|uniref:hypothetical protein n=1 Tax=Ferrovum sp. TaxID=2609467 RepID=UPI00263A0C69|nr:hypothetical protein [Ferrovum sp.]